MAIDIRLVGAEEAALLDQVAPDVFDNPVDARYTAEFLRDPRHHLAIALDGELVVGFASGVIYVHPDKPPELWINEVGVAATHRRLGLATRLIQALFQVARSEGCREAWVLTERPNAPAMGLYASMGGRIPDEETVLFSFALTD